MPMFTNNEELSRENLYEQIADSIERQIIETPELVGQQLPSEQAVANEFGVSRNVVREAFKVLKERGFIEVKNGVCSYVTKPDADRVGQAITRFVRADMPKINDVFEIRYALELLAAELTAQRGSAEDIAACGEYIVLMQRNRERASLWSEYDYLFHRRIVEAAGNALLLSLYESVSAPLKQLLEMAWGNEKAMSEGIEYHVQIFEALVRRSGEDARRLMSEHLTASKREMEIYLACVN